MICKRMKRNIQPVLGGEIKIIKKNNQNYGSKFSS